MSVNKVILIGNLGADPETRTSQSGNMVANLRVATTHRVKQGDQWENATEWSRVVCFGRTAENVERFCKKGKQLYIEGRLQTRKWTDKDGNDRWSTEVVANDIRFLGGREDGQSSGGQSQHRSSSGGGSGGHSRAGGSGHSYSDLSGGGDDDIPFTISCEIPDWVNQIETQLGAPWKE